MEKMESLPSTELVSVTIDGPICYMTLNRADKYNAMNVQMITELCELFEWTALRSVGNTGELTDESGSPYLRVIVLSGSGKHFCAGADINMMRDAGANTPEENRRDSERLDRLFNGLWSHPCFTIGSITGVALGGGAGLIACLDHVIASENVKIALSEGKLGILPAVIGPYVYRRLGSACFRRLAMQASRIDAEEALRTGFIEQVVESKEAMDEAVDKLVSEVMTTGPCAVTLAKELTLDFDRWVGTDEELREYTLDFTSRMRGSKEGQEGLSSFLEKRDANWKS
ncbi:MAG TPA: enoyl-CoA hydratase/isomerase family protein [Candidatus Poseidoniaceae archaeon]|jgi:methylglutaconyl-CoA hydratase|nr:MAG TPA: enoyl-CoA hydratase/isomerase family protein [Candidatus Poseidoniales archaeon]DAC57820.1 MAG TPA: enoyl-CoA hydratase/isomerase family protein [Candidatus Poseidoniales archaeon]HII23312.1 enoyl-CoA hydratase/isomerase family protein [Candidatus Poseidoniaceae archaeon]HII51012.1 enoyl-CoA hydratase/isomerase family protein [Candidatus Poseidoniaceae archaeon]|tara:strand:- start:2348 stop:3202 length:855 start_codon:yes stop_codon:yes gene_type:complete